MNKKQLISPAPYVSPVCKTVAVATRKMLCGSPRFNAKQHSEIFDEDEEDAL